MSILECLQASIKKINVLCKQFSTCFFVSMYWPLYRINALIRFCQIKSLLICSIARHSPVVLHPKLLIDIPNQMWGNQFFSHPRPCPTDTEVSILWFFAKCLESFKIGHMHLKIASLNLHPFFLLMCKNSSFILDINPLPFPHFYFLQLIYSTFCCTVF